MVVLNNHPVEELCRTIDKPRALRSKGERPQRKTGVQAVRANLKSHLDVRELEAGIHQNPIRNANDIIDLVEQIERFDAMSSKAIHAARRALLALEKNASSNAFRTWLSERRKDYAQALLSVLRDSKHAKHHNAAIASAALTHDEVFVYILRAVLGELNFAAVPLIYSALRKFPDLAYAGLRTLPSVACDSPLVARMALLFAASEASPGDAPARTSIPVASYRRVVTTAWLSVLHDPSLTNDDRLALVTRLPTRLLPNMTDPLCLADFLTACYDASHDNLPLSLAALDGLFILVSKHGLDYPRFYHKLYALLSHDAVTNVKCRHRFLDLTAMFLTRGSRLPGSLVAAFVKRLVRRAVTAPTASALWCLRLALELLRKHPRVSYLVQRSVNLFDNDVHVGNNRKRHGSADPFDDTQDDPEKSYADQSSLWELNVLKSHISSAVSRLVILFSTDMSKRPPPLPDSLEDYAALSFTDILQAEVKRKARALHVAYDTPGAAPHSVCLKKQLSTTLCWT